MYGFKSQLATNSVKIKSPKAEMTEPPMGIMFNLTYTKV
nr:MAG TPA: hypothetical protein [Caudoviricetes sp.]